jgi:hypothetical protein
LLDQNSANRLMLFRASQLDQNSGPDIYVPEVVQFTRFN